MSEETKTVDTQQPTTPTPEDNGGQGGKTFTQEEVNRIVSDRLAREREKLTQQPQEDEREKALKAREARLDCRDYLESKKYPVELMDVLDTSDADAFKSAVDKLAKQFPSIARSAVPAPYAVGTGTQTIGTDDRIAEAFKPKT